MRSASLFIFFLLCSFLFTVTAQPFRYITGSAAQRDSIRQLRIKGYREYSAPFNDSSKRILTSIKEYDNRGNMIRDFRHDLATGTENQYTWQYDSNNRLTEHTSYAPDSLTVLQRFLYSYDKNGNETQYIAENYHQGKFTGSSKTVSKYDSENHLISLKAYSGDQLHTHYEYRYNKQGVRTEELVYDPKGKLLWKRPASEVSEERMPYGHPRKRDPETEALFKVTVTKDPKTGYTTYTDGYGYRVFNEKGLLVLWNRDQYRYHRYEYWFYPSEK